MFSQSRSILIAAAATVAALGAMPAMAYATNLVLNGDFSANASAYTAYPGYDGTGGNPASPSGWISTPPANYGGLGVNGPDTASSVGSPFAPGLSNNVLPSASGTGSQDFAFLQSGATSNGGLSPALFGQTFSTVVGEKYIVTFDAAQRGEDTNAYLLVQLLDQNQNVLASATSATGGNLTMNANSWTANTLDFTADGIFTTLKFADDPTTSPGETVDFTNVSVAAVPDPATLGLVGLGGLGLLLIGRKRKLA